MEMFLWLKIKIIVQIRITLENIKKETNIIFIA